MSNRVSKRLIEKLQDVRDGYEAIGEYNNSTIDELIQKNLNDLLLKSTFNGDRALVAWCNKELDKEKMSHRLRRAVSLVPSGILEPIDHDHHHTRGYSYHHDHNHNEPINPFSGKPSQFPEFAPSTNNAYLNRSRGGKTRKMKNKKNSKKSIRRRKN